MDPSLTITELSRNLPVFQQLLQGLSEDLYLWKPQPGKWCLLEVVCHLYDEEREDFRARVRHTLETPDQPMPPIDPVGWVAARKYLEQDYPDMLARFLDERRQSVEWLQALADPQWDNTYQHPILGPLSARLFLTNWLAHDYLHFRQIARIKHQFLGVKSGIKLDYAGEW